MTTNELLSKVTDRLKTFGKLLYLTKHGSHLYGTNTPTSDEDYVGVFVANEKYQLGLNTVEEVDCSVVSKDEDGKNTADAIDIKVYELKKFIKLLLGMNPNIVDLFFSHTNSEAVIFDNKELKVFFDNPQWFINDRLLLSFMGYAKSQLKKGRNKPQNYKQLKKFNEFLKDLVGEGLGNNTLAEFRNDIKKLGLNVNAKQMQVNNLTFPLNYFVKKVYRMTNEKLKTSSHRAKSWEENGYDPKFFMHLFRLLNEGTQLATKGKLEFPLSDRNFYLSIRNGKYTLEELEKMMEEKFKEFEELKNKISLPKKPKTNLVEKEMINLIKKSLDK